VGKIAEKAVCKSVFLTSHNLVLQVDLHHSSWTMANIHTIDQERVEHPPLWNFVQSYCLSRSLRIYKIHTRLHCLWQRLVSSRKLNN